jgi:hypothetical protein
MGSESESQLQKPEEEESVCVVSSSSKNLFYAL